jgi:protein-S-isoprenylcysteine O-methyltransferase Ste14
VVQLLRDDRDEVTPAGEIRTAAAPAARRGALHRGFIRVGNLLFSTRNALFPLAFVAVALMSPPRAPLGGERADLALDALGIGVALAGQALRAAVIGLAYIRRGGKDRRIHADHLVTDGLFAHSRNPLYLGNLLVFVGLFMVLNTLPGYLVGVPLFYLAYLAITLAEEEFLERRFGPPYVEYCRRVNRFIPSPRGLGTTMRSMAFDWRRLVRKEYGSAFAWTTTAIGLLLWESVARLGWSASVPRARALGLAWLVLIAAYSLARYLKKSGRLSSAD